VKWNWHEAGSACFNINLPGKEESMTASNEIDARVASALVHALGVEPEDVKPTATLQGDLGAESIDFLDIVFRLEREFNIKIDHDELFPELVLLGGSALIDDGQVTAVGLAALHTHMPYADWTYLERNRRLGRIEDLFTVDLVVSYIRWKLDGGGATGRRQPRRLGRDRAPAI
jgi:acyl carrier protein